MILNKIKYPAPELWEDLLRRPSEDLFSVEDRVAVVLNEVKSGGDEAVRGFTQKFDGIKIETLLVQDDEIKIAEQRVSEELKNAIREAMSNIKKFHVSQKEELKVVETLPGVACWRRSVPIEKVGLYIPGGSAPLFSTILMLAIPAQIAGCEEIIMCTPPSKDGKINDVILFTAKLSGINKIFKIGGAQAIAAMGYGTETVPRVNKIFGPGNQYVTCAKQLISNKGVAIDLPAGPSELAVLADETCIPEFVAADLLSQAEHGIDSQVLLVTTKEKIIDEVNSKIQEQISTLQRKEIAMQALKNSKAILVKDQNEGVELLNRYAPEHLIIACENEEELIIKIKNAGSVFLGNYSCESAGDYASGTNHTLPTSGYAKSYSGVSLDSFLKKITFQRITAEGITRLGNTIELMAEAEGLQAHKNAVTLRLRSFKK